MTSSHRDLRRDTRRELRRGLRRATAAAALCGVAMLAAACGSSSGNAGAPAARVTVTTTASPPASTPPATPSPTASVPPACATSALPATIGAGNGAAGSTYYALNFTNTSAATCTLLGYPGVSFVTGVGGSQIGRAASRNPLIADHLVTLEPGATAHTTLQVVDALNYPAAECRLVTAHTLRIYPPNQTAPIYLSFTAPACSAHRKLVRILSVQAVTPGS
jgi:hypothetical protein